MKKYFDSHQDSTITISIEIHMELKKDKKFEKHCENQFDRYGDYSSIYDTEVQSHPNMRTPSAENEYLDTLFLENIKSSLPKNLQGVHFERLVLHYVHGYSMTEIAGQQGRSIRTIKESIDRVKNSFLEWYFSE